MLSYARTYSQRFSKAPLHKTVNNQVWHCSPGAERAQYIEALYHRENDAQTQNSTLATSKYGTLEDDDILNWVMQRGSYGLLDCHDPTGPTHGGIRLLMLERKLYQPVSFDIKVDTFLAIQSHFNLPEDALYALSNEGGISMHNLDVNEITGAP
ncbi:hypothetical protein EK21DRAFT_105819 [Setomelanomma holmii]|uniref:Uncharacterized protein n=1 Tax=Setomelanomma holmii TaxID=210430 RepID=A0A9P4HLL2_9PLEO|nr:hypothetical protein EK21DRAFT_105819 [Setomelanomma holmii]